MKKKKEKRKKLTKNKNGFTLIELLAVIVILAVIALIAVPQVLKILSKTRLSAAEDSTLGIVKSAETYVSNFMLKNSGAIPSEDLVFNCSSDGCVLQNIDNLSSYELDGLEKLEFKGTKPKSGTVIISDNGSDIQTSLVINNYGCSYVNGKSECSSLTGPTSYTPTDSDIGYTGVLKVVYLDPTNLGKGCNENNVNSDTGTKIGCMKWYVYNDDGTNYTMILDHNTTKNIYETNRNTQLASDTIGWDGSLNPRLIIADEINNITGKTNFNPNNWESSYWFESLIYEEPSPYPSIAKYGWLFDRTGFYCTRCGCLNNATGNAINEMTNYYWTDTTYGSYTTTWTVSYAGSLGVAHGNTIGNIRPVITVEKSKIS